MTLRRSMLAFVVSADDQNKSPEDKKVTISVATHFLTFLYSLYFEENTICFIWFWFNFFLFPHLSQPCVRTYVCIPEVLSFECKIK